MPSLRPTCLLLILLTALAASPPAVGADPGLSLEDVLELRQVTAAKMSPAGDRVAYLLSVPRELYEDADGPSNLELHVTDLDGQTRPFVTDRDTLSDFAWSADGASLFFIAKENADADVNSLYEIALAGGDAQHRLTHETAITAIYPAPDGATLAFTAAAAPPPATAELADKGFRAVVYEESVPNVELWLLDLDGDGVRRKALPGSISALAWSADARRYAVALAPTALVDDSFTARDIYVVDARSGRVDDPLGSIGKLGKFAFSPDGDSIAYIGSTDIHDPQSGRLYLVAADGGERAELVPNYDGHIIDFAWRGAGQISWLGHRGVFSEWQTTAVDTADAPGAAPTSGPILRAVSAVEGAPLAAAVADAPEHPAELYLLRDGEPPRRLTNSNPELAARALAVQEAIRYRARDGLELDAILIRPLRPSRGKVPLIVFAHGGPEAHFSNGWMTNYSRPGQAFAADGYAVVYPNYRGSTGRGVAFSKLGQNDYADEEFNDLVDAKRHLVEVGLVDGTRVGISGGSYGGYATMWSASALTEEYAAAVSFVGISNQISKFGTSDIPQEMYYVHSRAWPWDDWVNLLQRSPVYHAGKTRTPLLILTGDADPRVHPSQSLEMYRNVKLRTDTPVRLVYYPDEGHGNRKNAAQFDYALRLKRWMDFYLKGPGEGMPPWQLDHAARLEAAGS